MEANDCNNIFQGQAQVMAKAKTKVGKPPTRLQRKAPQSLEVNYATTHPFVPSASPIPLLSPLIVSPPAMEAEEFRFPVIDGTHTGKGEEDNKKVPCSSVLPGVEEWRHSPVANGYMEASSLFNFFQSKCVLVNHAK